MSLDTKNISLTAGQMRAARALIGMSGDQLAAASGVSLVAIRRAETDRGTAGMMRANGEAIRRALEASGVRFTDDGGVAPAVRG